MAAVCFHIINVRNITTAKDNNSGSSSSSDNRPHPRPRVKRSTDLTGASSSLEKSCERALLGGKRTVVVASLTRNRGCLLVVWTAERVSAFTNCTDGRIEIIFVPLPQASTAFLCEQSREYSRAQQYRTYSQRIHQSCLRKADLTPSFFACRNAFYLRCSVQRVREFLRRFAIFK